jgi:biopolymer transport protein ExbD
MSLRKRKTFAISPQLPPKGEINVTPLVDVVLVLLIIFMVVTPLLERAINVRTPSSEKLDDPDESRPDQIVVQLPREGPPQLNDEVVPLGELVAKLSARLQKKTPSQRVVFLVADDQRSYAELVAVIDRAKLAGAETLGFATEP